MVGRNSKTKELTQKNETFGYNSAQFETVFVTIRHICRFGMHGQFETADLWPSQMWPLFVLTLSVQHEILLFEISVGDV